MSSRPSESLADLPVAFLTSGFYLKNWSPRTLRTYRQGLATLPQELTKTTLAAWVMGLRDRGVQPGGVNMYARTANSYLTWLHEEGHHAERLRVKLLKVPQRLHTLLSAPDIRAIRLFKPISKTQRRAWVLVQLLLDTGTRIDEALGIEQGRVNLDALTIVVNGKGRKERVVPISYEMRKVLWKWVSKQPERFLFASSSGSRLMYRNAYRDIQTLFRKMGISVHVHPHLFRHQFAVTYIERGGNIYKLSRILGHTNLSTTQIYLRSMGIEQIKEGHDSLSPLNA